MYQHVHICFISKDPRLKLDLNTGPEKPILRDSTVATKLILSLDDRLKGPHC